MLKRNFIHVGNDLNKAIAFANTLDNNNILNVQRIKQKEFYIPTLDVVSKLQNEGWEINSVAEQRGKGRKIIHNFVRLQHPDFAIKNDKGKDEALLSLTVTNSCNGSKPINLEMGMYRLVCSNGAVRFDEAAELEKIKHTEINYKNLDQYLNIVNRKSSLVLNEFEKLKHSNLSVNDMRILAYESAKLRYNDVSNINIDDVLAVNRIEDEGNDLWTVFNRIQENLTSTVSNASDDILLNKRLFALAETFA